MKVSKILASAVAAVAVVGAVGIASAQSDSGAQLNNTPTAVGGEQTNPAGAARGSMNNAGSTGTMSTGTNSGTMQAQPSTTTTMSGSPVERPAQADRN